MNLRDEIIQIVATRDAETGYTWSAEQIADALLDDRQAVAEAFGIAEALAAEQATQFADALVAALNKESQS